MILISRSTDQQKLNINLRNTRKALSDIFQVQLDGCKIALSVGFRSL